MANRTSITVTINDVPIRVVGLLSEGIRGNEIDPPEPADIEIEGIFIGGSPHDVYSLFTDWGGDEENADSLIATIKTRVLEKYESSL